LAFIGLIKLVGNWYDDSHPGWLGGVPLGLAFSCLLVAVPGALAAAPFSFVLMAAFLTQVGALQTAPS
jgi:hypothetical protein